MASLPSSASRSAGITGAHTVTCNLLKSWWLLLGPSAILVPTLGPACEHPISSWSALSLSVPPKALTHQGPQVKLTAPLTLPPGGNSVIRNDPGNDPLAGPIISLLESPGGQRLDPKSGVLAASLVFRFRPPLPLCVCRTHLPRFLDQECPWMFGLRLDNQVVTPS